MRDFDKYQKWGDYHWREFERLTTYRRHVLYCMEWVKEKNVLDVGCGDGLIAAKIWMKGIDDNEIAVKLAKEHGVRAELGNVYDLEKHGKFDAVFLGDVIEHLDYPEKAIEEIGKITNVVYIVTPPRIGELRPYHVREFTMDELIKFMEDLGWTCLNKHKAYSRIYGKFKKSNLLTRKEEALRPHSHGTNKRVS